MSTPIGKTALITGASSGIGLELAHILAREGHHLVLVARSRTRLEALAAELSSKHGVRCEVITADLGRSGAPAAVVQELEARGLTIDVLVNNAGFGLYGPFTETPLERELEMIQLNIVALTELTKRLLPGMVARREGRILNISSTAAFQPGPLMAVYYATKAYVLHFGEALANELKGTGVTVTTLCPGATASGFQATAGIEETRMVRGQKLPSPASVAEAGYEAMRKGKSVYIPGLMNYLMAAGVRFMPRDMVTAVVRQIQASDS